jgi:very-short-patch-repair endonuclease
VTEGYRNAAYNRKKKILSDKMRKSKKALKPPDRKGRRRTGCEKAMIVILDNLYVEYEIEYPLLFACEWRIFDFCLQGNILIEVDGDYWHMNPELKEGRTAKYFQLKNKKNDMMKNYIAKKHGFSILRFWERDIFSDPDAVSDRVATALTDELS